MGPSEDEDGSPATASPTGRLPVPFLQTQAWVCCDRCNTWRRVPQAYADSLDDNDPWYCEQNPNPQLANCDAPAEPYDDLGDSPAPEVLLVEDHWKHRPSIWQLVSQNMYTHRPRRQQHEDEMMICDCPYKYHTDRTPGCGPSCMNRMLNIECVPEHCPSGDRCQNQLFSSRKYAKLELRKAGAKGYGLFAGQDIKEGQFIIEYMGEVLEEEEYQRRKEHYLNAGTRHYYFMNIGNGEVIDACRKGALGRFINHSCDPNCETQKWQTRGELAIGLFAIKDIAAGEELTFDYNFERYGDKPYRCLCGAYNCRGVIGGSPDSLDTVADPESAEGVDLLQDLFPLILPEQYPLDPALAAILDFKVGLRRTWQPALERRLAQVSQEFGVDYQAQAVDNVDSNLAELLPLKQLDFSTEAMGGKHLPLKQEPQPVVKQEPQQQPLSTTDVHDFKPEVKQPPRPPQPVVYEPQADLFASAEQPQGAVEQHSPPQPGARMPLSPALSPKAENTARPPTGMQANGWTTKAAAVVKTSSKPPTGPSGKQLQRSAVQEAAVPPRTAAGSSLGLHKAPQRAAVLAAAAAASANVPRKRLRKADGRPLPVKAEGSRDRPAQWLDKEETVQSGAVSSTGAAQRSERDRFDRVDTSRVDREREVRSRTHSSSAVKRRTEVDRQLELLLPHGRFVEPGEHVMVKVLRLFNLCDIGPQRSAAQQPVGRKQTAVTAEHKGPGGPSAGSPALREQDELGNEVTALATVRPDSKQGQRHKDGLQDQVGGDDAAPAGAAVGEPQTEGNKGSRGAGSARAPKADGDEADSSPVRGRGRGDGGQGVDGGQEKVTARQRARMADLSLLLDLVLNATSTYKRDLVRLGLPRQLLSCIGRHTGSVYKAILLKVLKCLEALPLKADDIHHTRSVHGSLGDLLRELTGHSDPEVRKKAYTLLKNNPAGACTRPPVPPATDDASAARSSLASSATQHPQPQAAAPGPVCTALPSNVPDARPEGAAAATPQPAAEARPDGRPRLMRPLKASTLPGLAAEVATLPFVPPPPDRGKPFSPTAAEGDTVEDGEIEGVARVMSPSNSDGIPPSPGEGIIMRPLRTTDLVADDLRNGPADIPERPLRRPSSRHSLTDSEEAPQWQAPLRTRPRPKRKWDQRYPDQDDEDRLYQPALPAGVGPQQRCSNSRAAFLPYPSHKRQKAPNSKYGPAHVLLLSMEEAFAEGLCGLISMQLGCDVGTLREHAAAAMRVLQGATGSDGSGALHGPPSGPSFNPQSSHPSGMDHGVALQLVQAGQGDTSTPQHVSAAVNGTAGTGPPHLSHLLTDPQAQLLSAVCRQDSGAVDTTQAGLPPKSVLTSLPHTSSQELRAGSDVLVTQPTSTVPPSAAAPAGGAATAVLPGESSWDSPNERFETFVGEVVRHRLGKYCQPDHPHRITQQDAAALYTKIKAQVIEKERSAYKQRQTAQQAKPIQRERLENKIKDFVRDSIRRHQAANKA